MLKIFPIDFIRQAFEQKLLEENIKNPNYFGGRNQVNIFSFYEQLKTQDEVDRFVENYRDLTEQQNRTGLILNGVLLSPENPTITNLYSSLIVPMSWTCSLRCKVENRDQAIETINNLIDKLKGRKVDIAQLYCTSEQKSYQPFMVGTIGQNDDAPTLKDGDYIGNVDSQLTAKAKLNELISSGLAIDRDKEYLLYSTINDKLSVVALKYNGTGAELVVSSTSLGDVETLASRTTANFNISVQGTYETAPNVIVNADLVLTGTNPITGNEESVTYQGVKGTIMNSSVSTNYVSYSVRFLVAKPSNFTPSDASLTNLVVNLVDVEYHQITDENSYKNFIFPPEHESFEKYKVSFSFDAIRCDEPRNLNENEYCELSFGGSATLVNESVQLGNDLLKVCINKIGIQAESYISFTNPTKYWLEPLEMPSGNNANTQISQLVSNNFVSNTHTDSIALTLQYTFIYDKSVDLLKQLFDYARYGTRGITANYISPNMDFNIGEIWSSWGEYENNSVKTKIIENIDIENTESDTLTLSLTMQIQGDNN